MKSTNQRLFETAETIKRWYDESKESCTGYVESGAYSSAAFFDSQAEAYSDVLNQLTEEFAEELKLGKVEEENDESD